MIFKLIGVGYRIVDNGAVRIYEGDTVFFIKKLKIFLATDLSSCAKIICLAFYFIPQLLIEIRIRDTENYKNTYEKGCDGSDKYRIVYLFCQWLPPIL